MMAERTIKAPFWMDRAKTRICCRFVYDDGREYEAVVSDTEEGNPDWKEIMDTFGVEGIDESSKEIGEQRRRDMELKHQQNIEYAEREKTDILFTAKLEAFEIEEVKNSTNRTLKSKIRKAKTIMEVQSYTITLIMKEIEKSEKAAKSTANTTANT